MAELALILVERPKAAGQQITLGIVLSLQKSLQENSHWIFSLGYKRPAVYGELSLAFPSTLPHVMIKFAWFLLRKVRQWSGAVS